jgi:hypothetical protein
MGGKIFVGQSSLRIVVKTFTDLQDVSRCVIKFVKPDGKAGEFTAAVSDASGGVIFHECLSGEIDRRGWWRFWAFIEFADGRAACGEAVKVFAWEEGK